MLMNLLAEIDVSKLFGLALRTSIGVQAATFALAAVGLNLHYGYTGLLNFGVVAFMAAGAYGMAIFFTQGWLGGSILLAISSGLAFAVIIALSIGLPSLRLRADYLALTTIAIAEVLRISFRSQRLLDLTGGPFGLPSIEDRNANVSFADVITVDWNPIGKGSYGAWFLEFDEKTLWVGSSSGCIHKLTLGKGHRDTHTIGNGNHFEEFRLILWKGEEKELWW